MYKMGICSSVNVTTKYGFKDCRIVDEYDNKLIANCIYYTKEFDEVNNKYNITRFKKVRIISQPTL